MIAVAQRDDFVIASVAARSQECSFVGLRSAVGEKALGEFPAGRDSGDALGEGGLRLIREYGGDVLQFVDLLMHLFIHLVIAMADADGDDAAEEIKILLPSISQTC